METGHSRYGEADQWDNQGAKSRGGGTASMADFPPKHTIFLSHSGLDKPFVRHLYAEFERLHYYPFFDQESHSLPTGERFPELIRTAARKCLVAVVVLSEDFVTSKWPMIELVTFVAALASGSNPYLKLAPLFFKANPDRVRRGLATGEFWDKLLWNELVKANHGQAPRGGFDRSEYCRVEQQLGSRSFTRQDYSAALSELLAVNGLRFEMSGNDDVKYIREVVKAVLQYVPRQLAVEITGIQASTRLCEEIHVMFNKKGHLGLYGKAGTGKSTICCEAMIQYMGSHHSANFRGYCRVRLDNDKAADEKGLMVLRRKKRLERLKQAIQQLVGMPKLLSGVVSEYEARMYLSNQLMELRRSVFLVVDNVSESSLDEARWYAKDLLLPPGSFALFTSRSKATIESLLGEAYCQPFPTLDPEEAIELFLSHALPGQKSLPSLTPEEADIVEACLSRCCIDDTFIPRLVCKFAFFLSDSTKGEPDISSWEDYIQDADSILALEYDKLDDMSKLIFLDLAIFADDMRFTHVDFHSELEWREHSNHRLVIDFIAMLHDINRHVAEKKVKELQHASLLEESKTEVLVSEDYKEFAYTAAMRPMSVEKLCMLCTPDDEEDFAEGTLRVILAGVSFDHDLYHLREWGTVQFLVLFGVYNLPTLDLQGLRSLRVLRVKECYDLMQIVCTCHTSSTDGRFCYQKKRGCLSELRVVQLEYLGNLKVASFPEHSRKLESLWFYECPNLDYLPDLRYCRKLKRLRLPCGDFNGFQSLSSNRALIELAFHWDPDTVRNFTWKMRRMLLCDVMQLTNLRILDIVDESKVYDWIPAGVSVKIGNLVHLTFLDLSCASTIEEVEGLERLAQLTSLGLYGCCNLRRLPNLFTSFKKLNRLCIHHCHKLPDMNDMMQYYGQTTPVRTSSVPQIEAFHAEGESCAFGEHECLEQHATEYFGEPDNSVCRRCTPQEWTRQPDYDHVLEPNPHYGASTTEDKESAAALMGAIRECRQNLVQISGAVQKNLEMLQSLSDLAIKTAGRSEIHVD